MSKNKIYLISIFLLVTNIGITQNSLNDTYQGFWGSSTWTYEFFSDQTFIYTTGGHFGYSKIKGSYSILNDTLKLIATKNDENKRSLEEYFLLDGDSCIIDLSLCYDYCNDRCKKRYYEFEEGELEELMHSSRKRNIKFPQIPTNKQEVKQELVVNFQRALSDTSFLDYLNKQKILEADFVIIQEYFEIDKDYETHFKINNKKVIILSEVDKIERPYIRIREINQSFDYITIRLDVMNIVSNTYKNYEDFWFTFRKFDNKWSMFTN